MSIPIFPTSNTIQKASDQRISTADYNSTILDQLSRYNLFFTWLATGLESDTVADGAVLSQNVVAKYEDVTSFVSSADYVQQLGYTVSGSAGNIFDPTNSPDLSLKTLATFQLSKFNNDKAQISLYVEILNVFAGATTQNFKNSIEISIYEQTLLTDVLTAPIKTIALKIFEQQANLSASSYNSCLYSNNLIFVTGVNSSPKYYVATAKITNPKLQIQYNGSSSANTSTVTIRLKPEFITVKYM